MGSGRYKKWVAWVFLALLFAVAACSAGGDDAQAEDLGRETEIRLAEPGQTPEAEYLVIILTSGGPVALQESEGLQLQAVAGAQAGDVIEFEMGGQPVTLSVGRPQAKP